MLYLGSIRMSQFISESCYKGTITQRNYCRKMTILWLFSYNSFVKFHDKKVREQHEYILSKSML